MPTLLLVDGHSQAYRAYFGLKTPLTTRLGEPTTAVYGFARKLLSVLKEYQPEYVAVAFDGGDTWRHMAYSGYKATRDRMPDDMRSQIERIVQFLKVFNVPVITYDNYEADDVLGTLARNAEKAGVDVLILTGDRDLFQLISDRVKILYTSGGPNPQTTVYGLDELRARYNLTPEQFIDLKALTGDSSDNIPGVPGVGEKTAIKYLNEYGSLQNLYANLDNISGVKARQNLAEGQQQVQTNRELVTIVTDLNLPFKPEDCRLRNYDRSAVVAFFEELEFRSLIKELPEPEEHPESAVEESDSGQMTLFGKAKQELPEIPANNYICVQQQPDLQQVVAALSQAQRISFDVETTSTNAHEAKLVGLGVGWGPGQAAYFPVAHTEGEQLPWEEVRAALQPFFANPDLPKVAHNATYDLVVCRRHGLEINGKIHDTMVIAWLLDPASRTLGLKAQAFAELGWQMTEITDLIGTGRKQITIDAAPISHTGAYCGADVDATYQLYDLLVPKLQESGVWPIYEKIELPLIPVITDMEMAGILLDAAFLREMSASLATRLGEIEQELYKLVGRQFNLRSTQQMSQVLFDDMKFPVKGMKRTASGHISTAVATLEQLAMSEDLTEDQRKLLSLIFEHRQLEKLRSTYVDALPALINPQTGRVHTSFNQTGAVTGRMSSSNPNLQNIPIRTELGREIRRAFIAPPGWSLISADYSQVELRILAHVAQEPVLIESFRAGEDIHAATAARLFDVPIEQVDRSQRALAKMTNFATIYGVSAFGLSSRTDMSREQADKFLRQYFATHPNIRRYVDETREKANRLGYVETLLGRKRYFPELQNSRLPMNQRMAVERAAINSPIQGTAADIMKIAMINLHEALRSGGYRARMLLQVHDELVLETPNEELTEVAELVCRIMESAYTLSVPLKVDVEAGPNWYNLEPIEINTVHS